MQKIPAPSHNVKYGAGDPDKELLQLGDLFFLRGLLFPAGVLPRRFVLLRHIPGTQPDRQEVAAMPTN